MIKAETLYTDDRFNSLLHALGRKATIHDFEEFRQDVFLEIFESGATCEREFARCAKRVAQRYWRELQRSRDRSGMPYAMPYYDNEAGVDDFFQLDPNDRIAWAHSEGLI